MIRRMYFVLTVLLLVIMTVVLVILWASSRHLPSESGVTVEFSVMPSGSDTLSIVSFNAGYFKGSTNSSRSVSREDMRSNLNSFAAAVRGLQPDLIALQEVDIDSRRTHHVDQVQWLSETLRFQSRAYAVAWNKRYVPFPGRSLSDHFGPITSGQGLISRFPITTNERIALSMSDSIKGVGAGWFTQSLAKMFYTKRIAQVSYVRVGSDELVLINVHLENSNASSRMKQIRDVISKCRQIDQNLPVIILGDFNSIVPEQRRSAWLTPAERGWFKSDSTVSYLLSESFDSFSIKSPETTFPATAPRLRFDHVFFNHWIEPIEEKVIYSSTASDHLPVFFRFKIRKP